MIRIESLWRSWNGFSLKDISFEVNEGEHFVVLGPTGSGKTVLLEIIAGFHFPDRGRILLRNSEITFLPPKKRGMGFVYQDYMLFPNMTVRNNIAYGLKVKGLKGKMIEEKVEELAGLLGIEDLMERFPGKLSGGEAQRTSLARALSIEPNILLLDEPLGALDPNLRSEIRTEISRLFKNRGTTIIHVTHSREDAIIMGDRIAIMKNGRIVQIDASSRVFRQPSSRFVAEFVGVKNIFKGSSKKVGDLVYFKSQGITLVATSGIFGEVYASIRPEDIILSLRRMKSSARNCIKGKVTELIDMGGIMRVMVDCGVLFAVNITRASCAEMEISPGKELYLIFKAQNVNLFS